MNSNWSYSPETVKLGCDLCDLDLWPWPFAWTLLLSLVITPENFMMIRWWEHSQKGVTDRRTDRRTENTICRAAWSQLKKDHGSLVMNVCTELLVNHIYIYIYIWIYMKEGYGNQIVTNGHNANFVITGGTSGCHNGKPVTTKLTSRRLRFQ